MGSTFGGVNHCVLHHGIATKSESPNQKGGPASSVAMPSNHVANRFDLEKKFNTKKHPGKR